MKSKLLMTARDAAAAFNLIEIYKMIIQTRAFEVSLYVSNPAAQIFSAQGIQGTHVDLPAAQTPSSPEGRRLLNWANTVLNQVQPDAVLCGLSTPIDGSIDEAIVASCDVPSFVMQDFWGEANGFFGKKADHYLCIDAEGKKITWDRHKIKGTVIGSPRHAVVDCPDFISARMQLRQKTGLRPNVPVIGFFGQALQHIPGYLQTLRAWCGAVRQLPGEPLFLYKPHPRENEDQIHLTQTIMKNCGVDFIQINHARVEQSLLLCDLVCSAFSNCSYDASYLNFYSDVPLLTPLSLFFNEEIAAYCKSKIKLDHFPFLEQGLGLGVRREEDLYDSLRFALSDECKIKVWKSAKSLPCPSKASLRAIAVIEETLNVKMVV